MAYDTSRISEHFVGNGTDFHENGFGFHFIDKSRMFVEGETMTETSCSEEDGIKEILVRGIAVSKTFACAGVRLVGCFGRMGRAWGCETYDFGLGIRSRNP